MKILSIEQATQFYNIVLPYLPDEDIDDPTTFASIIVNKIIEDEKYDDYLEMIRFFTDLSDDELGELGGEKVLLIFVEGLVENRIQVIKNYYEKLGFI